MSVSTGKTTYDPLPANTPKVTQISEEPQSYLLTEEKSDNSRRPFLHHVRHWRWELFTFTLGTGAFASILALLLRYRDDFPPPFPIGNEEIQLTAIIAALAQVAQSALLVPISYCIGQLKWQWFQRSKQTVDLDRFDSASRGPDGSIRLLWYLSWRQRLVSFGALATILMLVFPTFVQQSVQIGGRQFTEYNSDRASIARSVNIFEDQSRKVTLFSPASNASYVIDMQLSTALTSGATGYQINGLSVGDVGTAGICDNGLCTWAPFNTLALCYSTSNISQDITTTGGHVTLPALQTFLPKNQDPPSFQSGSHVYVIEGQSAAAPATSVSDGTNLPNLAEIYYLYYNVCNDRASAFNKSDPTRWTAFRGQFQLCVQSQEANTTETRASNTTLLNSTANLDWYKTTKHDESAFCTKVKGEKEDFCVAESVMQSLSFQMLSIFNTTATYSDMNRSDIRYSTEWGPRLAQPVLGDLEREPGDPPYCPSLVKLSSRSWGGVDPYIKVGEYGFGTTLSGIAHSLSDAFRSAVDKSEHVNGTYKYQRLVLLVNFRWFILPAGLYGIVTVFFLATIFTTRNTPLWKSSPLPLLQAMKEERGVGSEKKVKTEARETRMRLRRAERGWRLVEGTSTSSDVGR
ncbi:hypothetical protein BDV96DRAFT_639567 [Lophiotrema nucula]|uniref:Uncharacterized protein n=1 Tax=Lophiotrema nucula TaxID=690887 RepID=A0A6A5ZUQ7_9PLEO|nr:hypothetical protein BDV96DRAFT_639567 [Lophiotrema nucula]